MLFAPRTATTLPDGALPTHSTGRGTRLAGCVALSIVAIASGALVARFGYPPVLVCLATLAFGFLLARTGRGRRHAGAINAAGMPVYTALVLYVVPMLLLSRVYALVGFRPVYLPDALIVIAILLALPQVLSPTAPTFRIASIAVALLMLHAVVVGYGHHYVGATRGIVMVLYPLAAMVLASWLSARRTLDRDLASLAGNVLPLVTVGFAFVIVLKLPFIAAAYGLYLAAVGAFAVVPGVPHRRLLAVSCLVGLALLVGFTARRGPALAVLLGALAAWAASRSRRSDRAAVSLALAALLSISVIALSVSMGFLTPARLPVVGQLVARTVESANSSSPEAAHNVTLRTTMWSYALHTTATQGPLLGVGAFRPIEVSLYGNNIASDPESGVHNSFIGYAFYAGFPAGALVVFIFASALLRLWRVRRTSIYAPALFGALVAVVVTAFTNVALETTYIAGPSWLVVAAAFAVSARTQSAASANLIALQPSGGSDRSGDW